jgi:aminoglycoside 6'-N-acetyltransferase
MAGSYGFRAMSAADLGMIRHWLDTPEVIRWWGDPDQQYALVSSDLEHPGMDQFIVSIDGRPFGYIQCYALSAWNQGFGSQPPGTRGIDQFIGEPDMLGRGHGSDFIRQFVEAMLRAGTPRMVTDPDPANTRAVRAYEKAGFRRDRVVDMPDGPALLMVRSESDLSRSQTGLS